MALFEYGDVDRRYYAERIEPWLPPRVLDVHTHVWNRPHDAPRPGEPVRTVTWPSRVAAVSPIDELLETYRILMPGRRVTPLIFPDVTGERPIDELNAEVAEAARRRDVPALLFATPEWPAEAFERRVLEGGFLGAKVYLTRSPRYLPGGEIRILDFLPPHQLAVLDRHGWVVMLHIPRAGRLRDRVNLAQLLEIEQRYPNARVIVAHVGRAYCEEDVGDAFETLAPAERLRFDFSANTNETVFRRLIDAVGPGRILFGSDLPITRMRMRRICEGGRYVNLVPPGLYGDVSGDPNLREVDAAEGARLTFFLYEQIAAFLRAAQGAGLSPADLALIFHDNAAEWLGLTG